AGADADGEAGRGRTGRARGRGREGDGLAVDDQRGAVGDRGGEVVRGGAGGADQQRAGGDGDGGGVVVVDRGAGGGGVGEGGGDGAGGGRTRERRVGIARTGAEQVVDIGARDRRGRDAGFAVVADRGLQHLVGNRLGGRDQALQRGDAGVGGLQHLHAVADTVEQIGNVTGATVERGRGEVVGRVVQRGIDLVTGRKIVLRGGEQCRRGLQRKQVLANRRRENNTGHWSNPPRI